MLVLCLLESLLLCFLLFFSGYGVHAVEFVFLGFTFLCSIFRLFWVGGPIYMLSSIGFEIQERPIGIYRDGCVLIFCNVIGIYLHLPLLISFYQIGFQYFYCKYSR
jgi:hypothetical protein